MIPRPKKYPRQFTLDIVSTPSLNYEEHSLAESENLNWRMLNSMSIWIKLILVLFLLLTLEGRLLNETKCSVRMLEFNI